MAESEDEYDGRKRRDKFRGERLSSEGVVGARSRDEPTWSRRPAYTQSGGSGYEPIAKRPRPASEYYVDPYYGSYGSKQTMPNHYGHHHHHHHPTTHSGVAPGGMLSLKAFLAKQQFEEAGKFSEKDAFERYDEYKLEFLRQQAEEFFATHKDDEWFRLKYHPEESAKRKEAEANALKKRLEVFIRLFNEKKIESVSVDYGRTDDLLKLLDTVMILLEDGNEEDFAALDEEYARIKKGQKPIERPDKPRNFNNNVNLTPKPDKKESSLKPIVTSKDDSVVVETPPMLEKKDVDEKSDLSTAVNEEGEIKAEDSGETENKEESENSSLLSNDEKPTASEDGETSPSPKDETPTQAGTTDNDEGDKQQIEIVEDDDEDDRVPSRNLHKTTSIFLRNLAPTITKPEIEAMCSRYPGFLRVALADPLPERNWMRKGWVTFKRDANIKEICWSFNNVRLRDCELGAIVSKDLSKRIRIVNGITAHKPVVRSDIRISAKVAMYLDDQASLWANAVENKDGQKDYGFASNNPVLQNITDYLIEEASAEEEELLGLDSSLDNQDSLTDTVERDEMLLSALDRIVLYLRIVHSVDYYNHCKYGNEHEMPNRCGILHARGPPPTAKTDVSQFVGEPVELKLASLLPEKPDPERDKAERRFVEMTLKDADAEVDKFIQANTKEITKDKWLCPLSGKKFKAPDFIRKHILNKHTERIKEVRGDVVFFNNYASDPKRPLPEGVTVYQPVVTATAKRNVEEPLQPQPPMSYGGGYGAPPAYGTQPPYAPRSYSTGRSYGGHGYGSGRGGSHYGGPRYRGSGGGFRQSNRYRDLDAPQEMDDYLF